MQARHGVAAGVRAARAAAGAGDLRGIGAGAGGGVLVRDRGLVFTVEVCAWMTFAANQAQKHYFSCPQKHF